MLSTMPGKPRAKRHDGRVFRLQAIDACVNRASKSFALENSSVGMGVDALDQHARLHEADLDAGAAEIHCRWKGGRINLQCSC